MNAQRRAASLLLGVILAACANAPASPTPAGSTQPPPSATPALSPGRTAAASATATPDPSPVPTTTASGLPAGSHHELVCSEDGTECQLHLYDVAGREQPGWPRDLVGGCWPQNLAVGTDGVAWIACKIDDQQVLFGAVDVSGASVPGWPISATGYPLRVEVGRDGTVYLGTVNEAGDGILSIHAFGPDGHPRAGWPMALPRTADFAIAPDGTVVGWWYEGVKEEEDGLCSGLQAARTKYTMIGPNGRTLPGRWPVTSIGNATAPVIGKDGSLFYTSATAKVWGHDRGGNIIDGWPYQLPYAVPLELRPDGRLMFIVEDGTGSDSEVIVLTTAGRVASGWPYRTSSSLYGPQCCLDCCGSYFPHALAADGTLYLAPWDKDGAQVVALDQRGRVVTGWPYRLLPGWRVVALEMGSAGRLVVGLRDCSAQSECCYSDASRQITLTPAGELAP